MIPEQYLVVLICFTEAVLFVQSEENHDSKYNEANDRISSLEQLVHSLTLQVNDIKESCNCFKTVTRNNSIDNKKFLTKNITDKKELGKYFLNNTSMISNKEVDAHKNCSTPSYLANGEWYCYTSPPNLICSLECYPGYVPYPNTITSCLDGNWSLSPKDMTCPAAQALLTGGLYISEMSVEIYSLEENCSKILPNLPHGRAGHTVDYVDGHVLLCGGLQGGPSSIKSCLEMDDSFTWSQHSSITTDRWNHGSFITGGQISLIGGGQSKSSYTSSEFLVMPDKLNWSPGVELLEETSDACSVKVAPDSFIVTGGYHRKHVILYNINDGSARRLENFRFGRHFHGCSLVRNNSFVGVLVAGGKYVSPGRYHNEDYLNNSEMMDLGTGVWLQVGPLNTARSNLKMVVLKERILAMGGKNMHHNSMSSVEQFNLTTLSWSFTRELLQGRFSHAVTTIPGLNC